jgi:hypothetical protein
MSRYCTLQVCESFEAPPSENVDAFYHILIQEPYSILTRIRREMGQDIAGACGQLALIIPNDKGGKGVMPDIEEAISARKAPLTENLSHRNAATPLAKDKSVDYAVVAMKLCVVSALCVGVGSFALRYWRDKRAG